MAVSWGFHLLRPWHGPYIGSGCASLAARRVRAPRRISQVRFPTIVRSKKKVPCGHFFSWECTPSLIQCTNGPKNAKVKIWMHKSRSMCKSKFLDAQMAIAVNIVLCVNNREIIPLARFCRYINIHLHHDISHM